MDNSRVVKQLVDELKWSDCQHSRQKKYSKALKQCGITPGCWTVIAANRPCWLAHGNQSLRGSLPVSVLCNSRTLAWTVMRWPYRDGQWHAFSLKYFKSSYVFIVLICTQLVFSLNKSSCRHLFFGIHTGTFMHSYVTTCVPYNHCLRCSNTM